MDFERNTLVQLILFLLLVIIALLAYKAVTTTLPTP